VDQVAIGHDADVRHRSNVPYLPRPRVSRPVAIATLGLTLAAASLPMGSTALAGITRSFSPSSESTLAPGIEYSVGRMRTTGGRIQSVRVGTIDTSHPGVRLRSLLSNDLVVGLERPSRLAIRKGTPTLRPMVATNGDFSNEWRNDAYAAPHSMHVSSGELWVSPACARPTLGIDGSGDARIDEVRVHISVNVVGREAIKRIHRVNTHRDDHLIVLYTHRFASSTQTAPGGTEVVVDLEHALRPRDVQVVPVRQVRRGEGNTQLDPGKAVLSVRGPNFDWVRQLHEGQRLRIETKVVRGAENRCGGMAEANGWGDIQEAMGGNHFTARNGRVASLAGLGGKDLQRHPRTNVGVTRDGRVLMVTVDGRQPGYSIGVSLADAGRLMLSLGAVDAFNLDGGGSTVMAARSPLTGVFRVANRPSDGRERRLTQALAVYEVTGS
jgi:Phosphodiester glycosidase